MQVDSEKLGEITSYLSTIVIFPIQLIIAVVVLYNIVGISFTPGFIILTMMGIFNYIIGKLFAMLSIPYLMNTIYLLLISYQKQNMEEKDKRMKLMSETMNGIRYIKMSGWEEYFMDKVNFKDYVAILYDDF